MSKRIYELFLFDILVAILKIEYVSNKFDDAEKLKYDFISWDSVIREFGIIGEATNILIKNDCLEKENQIVVDFRNLLIYHYFGIDAEEVFDVIQNDLMVYKRLIEKKIVEIEPNLKNELLNDVYEENKYLEFIAVELKILQNEIIS